MNNRILCAALAVVCAFNAHAALEAVEEAVEAALASVELPAHEASRVVIRECASCDAQVYRVNSETRYQIGAATVTLADIRAAATGGGEQSLVYVFYGVDHGFVTRIVLDLTP